MKKLMALIVSLTLALSMAVSCGGNANGDGKTTIVTTIFSVYDWVMEIVGDDSAIEVVLLIDDGTDLHSYQPTTKDLATIAECEAFIYVGGESDTWVEDVLKTNKNKNLIEINLLHELGDKALEEEIVDGMEHSHDDCCSDENYDHASEECSDDHCDHDHDHEHGEVYDEHIWLSVKNASLLTKVIADKISDINVEKASEYVKNANDYIDELNALDQDFESAISSANCKTLIFGDRFPFRYLCYDYSLNYYGAFAGCSAETEASFETIAFLVEKVNELNAKVVISLSSSNGNIAKSIINDSNDKTRKIVTMDAIEFVTAKQIQEGAKYIDFMKSNLEALKEAVK